MEIPLFILFCIGLVLTLAVVYQASKEAERRRIMHKRISGIIERNMKK